MIKKIKILSIVAVFCWIVTIASSVYVLYNAYNSVDGTIHGFNGEMLYGIDAFIDTILMYSAFWFPLFILWGVCLIGAIVSTVAVFHIKKKSE